MFRFGDPGGRMYGVVGTNGVNLLTWWTSSTNGNNWTVSSGNGRTGGSSLRQAAGGNNNLLYKTIDPQSTWGVAFAFRTTSLTNNAPFLYLLDGASTQIDLRMNADGTLSVTRAGTALGTSSASLLTNSYAHLELKVFINNTSGTIELRKNGVSIIGPLTGQNTRATTNNSANSIQIGYNNSAGAIGTWDYDDFIVWDGQTTDPNGLSDIHDFIGDCGLNWLVPSGAGTTTQFTPLTGSNYSQINESVPDGDTSYVSSSGVGNIDTYQITDLGTTAATIRSIGVVHYARKDDVGSRSINAEIRTNGTNYMNSSGISLSNSYQYYMSNWGSNPSNSGAWSVSAINALEAGQQVTS